MKNTEKVWIIAKQYKGRGLQHPVIFASEEAAVKEFERDDYQKPSQTHVEYFLLEATIVRKGEIGA